MWHLIGEILVFMLITAVLWGAVGWWLRSLGHGAEMRRAEHDWSTRLATLRRSRDSYRDQLEQAQVIKPGATTEGGQVITDGQRAQITGHIKKLEGEISAGRERLAGMDRQMTEISSDAAARNSEIEELRKRLATAVKALRERDERLVALQAKSAGDGAKDDQVTRYEQTIERLRERLATLSANPEAERDRVEHGKLLNVIQAQKKTIASLNERLRAGSTATAMPAATETPAPPAATGGGDQAAIIAARDATIRELNEQRQLAHEKNDQLTERTLQLVGRVEQQDEEIAALKRLLQESVATDAGAAQAAASIEAQANRIADLEQQLGAAVATARTARDKDAELKRATEALREQEQMIAGLREKLRDAAANRQRTVARSAASTDHRSGDLFGKRPAFILTEPDGQPDDLQLIHGVGPVLASKLNSIGIYHFRQVAALTDQDIAWVAAKLDSFPNRILRDRWVSQAGELESRRGAGE